MAETCQTCLPIDQLELNHLLHEDRNYSKSVDFEVIFGFIKELTLLNGEVKIEIPSKVGKERFQAFIFKRKNDSIASEGKDVFVNEKKIDFDFSRYDVNIFNID